MTRGGVSPPKTEAGIVPLQRVIVYDSGSRKYPCVSPPRLLQGPGLCDGYHMYMYVCMGYITGVSIPEENIMPIRLFCRLTYVRRYIRVPPTPSGRPAWRERRNQSWGFELVILLFRGKFSIRLNCNWPGGVRWGADAATVAMMVIC